MRAQLIFSALMTLAALFAPHQSSAFEFDAQWRSTCQVTERIGLMGITVIETKAHTLKRSMKVYKDIECKEPLFEMVQWGTFKRVPVASNAVKGADVWISRMTVKPLSPEGVNVLTFVGFCSQDSWVVDESRDVTDAAGSTQCFDKKLPWFLPLIYSLDGERLFVGAKVWSNNSGRPRELDPAPYTRVR